MGYIDSGKKDGATLYQGGDRHGDEGYFINPTIFTDVKPDMEIVKEEIFGPVGVVIKFEDEAGKKNIVSVLEINEILSTSLDKYVIFFPSRKLE